jgi:hypothetical protein
LVERDIIPKKKGNTDWLTVNRLNVKYNYIKSSKLVSPNYTLTK